MIHKKEHLVFFFDLLIKNIITGLPHIEPASPEALARGG